MSAKYYSMCEGIGHAEECQLQCSGAACLLMPVSSSLPAGCSSECRLTSSRALLRKEAEDKWRALHDAAGLPVHVFRLGGESTLHC